MRFRPRTWLLTGIPRSGSSLACRLAGQAPDVVALSEPIPGKDFTDMTDPRDAREAIRRFVRRTRKGIRATGLAPSLQVAGRLDDNVVAVEAEAGLRRRQAELGEIRIDKVLSRRFTLVVKHNALFAALLPELTGLFDCLALVRNPLAVLASWQTVDLPVGRGRIPAGEQFDPQLRVALDAAPDVLARQLIVLDWFFAQYADNLPGERVLRYESLVEGDAEALYRLLGRTSSARESLANRNAHGAYGSAAIEDLLTALEVGGAWTRFYAAADCEQAAEAIRATGDGS